MVTLPWPAGAVSWEAVTFQPGEGALPLTSRCLALLLRHCFPTLQVETQKPRETS